MYMFSGYPKWTESVFGHVGGSGAQINILATGDFATPHKWQMGLDSIVFFLG